MEVRPVADHREAMALRLHKFNTTGERIASARMGSPVDVLLNLQRRKLAAKDDERRQWADEAFVWGGLLWRSPAPKSL